MFPKCHQRKRKPKRALRKRQKEFHRNSSDRSVRLSTHLSFERTTKTTTNKTSETNSIQCTDSSDRALGLRTYL